MVSNMAKTLDEIKANLIDLTGSVNCNTVTVSNCYVVNDITYSITYKKVEGKFYMSNDTTEATEV